MDEIKLISGIIINDLKIIDHPKGEILHLFKQNDLGYYNFGEAYISKIKFNCIKAWKRHLKMTSNLIIPIGEVKIVIYDNRIDSPTFKFTNEFVLSIYNYKRITIPPKLWYGFKGLSQTDSYIINFSNIIHDPLEQESADLSNFELNYKW